MMDLPTTLRNRTTTEHDGPASDSADASSAPPWGRHGRTTGGYGRLTCTRGRYAGLQGGTWTDGDDHRLAQSLAACRNGDPDALFVQGAEQNVAKRICRELPGSLRVPGRRARQPDRVRRVGRHDRAGTAGAAAPAPAGGELAARCSRPRCGTRGQGPARTWSRSRLTVPVTAGRCAPIVRSPSTSWTSAGCAVDRHHRHRRERLGEAAPPPAPRAPPARASAACDPQHVGGDLRARRRRPAARPRPRLCSADRS